MSSARRLVIAFSLVCMFAVTAWAERPARPSSNLRGEVLAWLDAADRFDFIGTIEFNKQLNLPADPDRVQDIENARQELTRSKVRYEEQLDAVVDSGNRELVDIVKTNYERTVAQYGDVIRYFDAWSKSGVEVKQTWRVIYLSPDDLRVDFSSAIVDPPTPSLIPLIQVESKTYGEPWGWAGISTPDTEAKNIVYSNQDPNLLRQARQELDFLLDRNIAHLTSGMLVEVEALDDSITATFERHRVESSAGNYRTTLIFDRNGGELLLRSLATRTWNHYVIWTYDDFRSVGERNIAFRKQVRSGPLLEMDLTEVERVESMDASYQINRLELGLTQEAVDLLEDAQKQAPCAGVIAPRH